MAKTTITNTRVESEHPREPRRWQHMLAWHRLALLGIFLLAVFMDFYQLGQNGFDSYYPPAVRSMMDSWHNFFFAAYDPGGYTSLDKPPLGFWLQVISAKIFGLNPASVLLPQALAGVLSVLLLYYLVRRRFGVVAGLIAALVLAVSPVSVVTNRNVTIDSTLALTLLVGAWAVLRAAETGRLRWLLLCAFIVGIGFNIKMMEAYLVVPAFGLLYLLAAPTSVRRRVLHLALALLVLLAVSLSWATVVDLTPASQRPHVGTTQDNSELSLALGYNGIQRLLGMGGGNQTHQAAPKPSSGTISTTGPAQGNGGPTQPSNGGPPPSTTFGGPGGTGATNPLHLFTAQPLAQQESWLLPLALLSLLALGWQGRPHPREDHRVHALILWGMWLLTMGIFFSVAGFIHEYYLTVMAPALAALCGIGLVVMWRDYRGKGWRGWLLPAALLLTAAEQIVLLTSYPTWGRWMIPLLTVPCILAAGVLISARLPVRLPGKEQVARVLLPVLAVGLVALVFAPTVWAAIPILQGTESDIPLAGPAQQGSTSGVLFTQGSSEPIAVNRSSQHNGPIDVDPALVHYLEEHQGHARVLAVTDNVADGLILATNKPVIPLGGFSGYPLTTSEAASLVANGTVRFFLLGGNSSVTPWVTQHCTTVPPSLWQSSPSNAQVFGNGLSSVLKLYDCATPRR